MGPNSPASWIGHEVRMIQGGRRTRFPLKARPAPGVGQGLGPGDLQRHLAIEHRVVGQIHNAEAAPAEDAADQKAAEPHRDRTPASEREAQGVGTAPDVHRHRIGGIVRVVLGTQLLEELHTGQPPFQTGAQLGRLGVVGRLGRPARGQGFIVFQQAGGKLVFEQDPSQELFMRRHPVLAGDVR